MPLDQVLCLSARAVATVIEPLRGTVGDVCNNVADVETFSRRLDPRDNAAGMQPGFGAVAGLGVIAHHIQLTDRATHAYLIGQDRVGGQTEDIVDTVLLAPVHRLPPAVMAVASDGDACVRPVQPDAPHQTT